MGWTSSNKKAEEINEKEMVLRRLNERPTATKLNMVTALRTDADPPAMSAKNQSKAITKIIFINLPCRSLSRGCNKK